MPSPTTFKGSSGLIDAHDLDTLSSLVSSLNRNDRKDLHMIQTNPNASRCMHGIASRSVGGFQAPMTFALVSATRPVLDIA